MALPRMGCGGVLKRYTRNSPPHPLRTQLKKKKFQPSTTIMDEEEPGWWRSTFMSWGVMRWTHYPHLINYQRSKQATWTAGARRKDILPNYLYSWKDGGDGLYGPWEGRKDQEEKGKKGGPRDWKELDAIWRKQKIIHRERKGKVEEELDKMTKNKRGC